MSGVLETALTYASKGWRLVRIKPNGKAPNVGNAWQERATTDPVALITWFSEQPDANLGVLCDRAFGWVLDVDDPKVLEFFAAKGLVLPRTLTAKTPSGGLHLVFKHPPGWVVRCSADGKALERLKAMGYEPTPGKHTIDTRGLPGGQVVIAPSTRDGHAYEWIDATNPVDAPDWLLSLVSPAPAETTLDEATVAKAVGGSEARELSEEEHASLERICSPVFDLPEGRYTALYEAAVECGRAGLPFPVVLDALDAAATANGYKAKDERGARRQITRGWAFGRSKLDEQQASSDTVSRLREKMGFASREVRAEPEREVASDPAAARRVLWELGGTDALAFDESTFWRYADERGIWEELGRGQVYAATEMALAHHVFVDKDTPEKLTIPYMGRVREALSLELTAHGGLPFFASEQRAIAVRNGVLEVEAGRVVVRPHDRTRRLRFGLSFDWDPAATAPRFQRVLDDAMSPKDQSVLAEWFGAALFGAATDFQKLLLLVGKGANGKSVILDVCAALFERLSAVPPDKLGDDRMVASLAGARLNLVSDISNRSLRDTGPLKAAVVGDVLAGRDVYKSAISFRPRCGFAYSCNELPSTLDTSDGFFRRFIVIRFERVIPPEARIPGLGGIIIRAELPGVLRWMVEGYLRLRSRGRFDADESVLEEWRADNDWLAEFLRDVLEPLARNEKGGRLAVEKIFHAYQAWSMRNGVSNQIPQKVLTRLVRARGWVPCKTWDNKSRALALDDSRAPLDDPRARALDDSRAPALSSPDDSPSTGRFSGRSETENQE